MKIMKRKKRQLISWFISYISIFLICAVLAFAVFRFVLSVLREQTGVTLEVASGQIRNFCDSEFEKQQLAAYTVINSNLRNFFDTCDEKVGYQRTKSISHAVDMLKLAFENIDSLKGCSVISKNTDTALSFTGYTTKKEVYDYYFKEDYSDFDKWSEEIFSFDGQIKYTTVKTDGTENFAVLYKPEQKDNTIAAVMVINSDKLLRSPVGSKNSNEMMCITSDTGKVMLASKATDISQYQKEAKRLKINGEYYYLASTDSKVGPIKYTILFPEKAYNIKTGLVIGISTVAVLLCMVLCLIAAYFMAKKQYLPIDRIIRKIGKEYNYSEKELSFIEKEFEKIVEKNNSITLQLSQREVRLRDAVLANLIRYKHELSPEQLWEKFGIDLKADKCLLIVFEIADSGVFGNNGSSDISVVLSNIFSELMENTAKCYFIHVEKKHICIVNSNNTNILDTTYENTEFLTGFVAEQFGIDMKCVISKCDSLYNLSELYSQTQELLKLKNTDWKIMLYDEIVEYITEEYSKPEETNEQLSLKEETAERIYEYIGKHFEDPMLNISSIAGDFDITINYLSRIFKKRYGTKPSEYLLKLRVEKAADMLKTTTMSVSDVATQCGFLNSAMFIRAFKKIYKITPGMYANLK